MKRTKYDSGSAERSVLTGMIVNRHVLASVADKWTERGLFPEPWGNIVGQWCVDYYEKYQAAPRKDIEPMFEKWSRKHKDKDTVGIVESFLTKLSKEYIRKKTKINPEFILDQAKELFTDSQVLTLQEEIEQDRESGRLDKAVARIAKFTQIEIGKDSVVDVFSKSSKELFRNAFETRNESVITYNGAVGNFFGKHLEREGFVCFMGPEKVGKTWMLIEMAMRGVLQGRKVAFFEVGDMSEAQIMRRLAVRIAKRPLDAGEYSVPVSIMPNEPMADVQTELKTCAKGMSWEEAWRKTQKQMKKGKEGLLKLFTYPNDSITAGGIKTVLEREARRGWCPDVVVIDYADILAPPQGYVSESREAINWTWKKLRAMSQEFHCLVVSATQVATSGYDTKVLTKKNFSNDKRKFAHVTAMIGLNVTETEKDVGLMRLNYVVLREGKFSESKCVHIAGSYAIARPIMFSTF